MKRATLLWSIITAALTAQQTSAATIVGGSTLMSGSDANQLETWLGAGPITLTNIFTHTAGDGKTSYDFHAAADGRGATFSLVQVLPGTYFGYPPGGDSSLFALDTPEVIGGYDPQSWSSYVVTTYTPLDADRTAFLFNLTTLQKQSQRLGDTIGGYQTFNAYCYGPTFGGGHDLEVAGDFSGGFAFSYSYGSSPYTQNIVTDSGQYYTSLDYGTIEVFTISAAAVPEPATIIVWSVLGVCGMGIGWRRRKRAA